MLRQQIFLILFLASINLPAFALSWSDLWQRRDQQAMHLLRSGDAKQAAKTFEDPNWQAYAAYRAGDTQRAEQIYKHQHSALAQYNLGNLLAKKHQYRAAIAAFRAALAKDPTDQDAAYNKQLLEKLLQQQQKHNTQKQTAKQSKQAAGDQNRPKTLAPRNPASVQPNQQPNQTSQPTAQHQSASSNPSQKGQDKAKHTPKQQRKSPQSHPEDHNPRRTTGSQPLSLAQQNLQEKLKQLPDHPGELLAQKFRRDYYRRHQAGMN